MIKFLTQKYVELTLDKKQFAFVNYEKPESAQNLLSNYKEDEDIKALIEENAPTPFIFFAQSKAQRLNFLRMQRQSAMASRMQNMMANNFGMGMPGVGLPGFGMGMPGMRGPNFRGGRGMMGGPQMMGMGRHMGGGMQGMGQMPGGNMMQPGMNPQNYMQNLGGPGFGMQGFNQPGQPPRVPQMGGMQGPNPGVNPGMGGGMASLTQQMGNMNINQNPMQQVMGGTGATNMANPMQGQQGQPQPFPNTTYGQGQQPQIDTTPTFKSPSNPGMFNQAKTAGPLKNPENHEEWKGILSVLDLDSQCKFIQDNKDSFIKLSEVERSQMLGDLMYALLSRKNFDEETKGNMTSMFIDPEVLSLDEIINMLVDDDVLNERIEEANEILQDSGDNEGDN